MSCSSQFYFITFPLEGIMTVAMLSRYMGAMVGTLVGDSVWAFYENQRASFIAEDLKRRGGLVFFDYIDPWQKVRQMKAGQPTDDSELAAALAQSLIVYPGFNPFDLYTRLRSFIHGRVSILTDEEAYGSGGTLRKALLPTTHEESCALFDQGKIPLIPSNGSLMRSIAIPLRFKNDSRKLVEVARDQSCVTHRHPWAQAACVVYSVFTSEMLGGSSPGEAWDNTRILLGRSLSVNPPEAMEEILSVPVSQPSEEEIWGTGKSSMSGSVVLSFRIALWATVTATDFRDGITKAGIMGGDTDTYAAIAGGLLGAHFGYEAIPQEWRNTVIGRERMELYAKRLYELAS